MSCSFATKVTPLSSSSLVFNMLLQSDRSAFLEVLTSDPALGAGADADASLDACLLLMDSQLLPNQLKLSLLFLLQAATTRPVSCQALCSPAAWSSCAVDQEFRKGSNAPHAPAALNSCH